LQFAIPNFSSDAHRAKLLELKGIYVDFSRAVYAKSVIQGIEDDRTGRARVEGIHVSGGYPKGNPQGIGKALINSGDWSFNWVNGTRPPRREFVITFKGKENSTDSSKIKKTGCYLSYKENLPDEPVIKIISDKC
jgi:hypothetical protein